MNDACCGGSVDVHDDDADGLGDRWKSIAALVSAVAWTLGIVAGFADSPGVADRAFIAAVMVGGVTFAPGAVSAALRGRLGVDVLMTIAGVGAIVLDQLGEAAALAFLFSVSEALEEWGITKSRRGLRVCCSSSRTLRRFGAALGTSTW